MVRNGLPEGGEARLAEECMMKKNLADQGLATGP